MILIKNKRTIILCSLLTIGISSILGQTLPAEKIEAAILSTSDRTYISFGQGLGNYKTPYGIKKLNPLIFEGQISPDFLITLSKKRNIGLSLFPKIVIRMYNEPSVPVRTPSYMPNVLLYHKINWNITKKFFSFFRYEEKFAFMTYRLMHHSNGQRGPHLIEGTDSVNYTSGNFSTNAIEVAFNWSVIDSGAIGKAFTNGRVSYERQLDFSREPQLKNTYYYNKVSIQNHILFSEKVKLFLTTSIMWGTKQFKPRNSIDLFLSLKPFPDRADFSVFMRGYIGPDYYNLYYENSLRAFTIGIIVDPLKIPLIRKSNKRG